MDGQAKRPACDLDAFSPQDFAFTPGIQKQGRLASYCCYMQLLASEQEEEELGLDVQITFTPGLDLIAARARPFGPFTPCVCSSLSRH